MFKGSNVALITPFKNNLLDEEAYIKLIYASSSSLSFLNGVTKATFDPLNINTYNIH